MYIDIDDTLERAVRVFGSDNQIIKLFEEIGELTDAVCKTRAGRDSPEHIAEEAADVSIMIEQLLIIFGIDPGLYTDFFLKKIERLKGRLDELQKGSD